MSAHDFCRRLLAAARLSSDTDDLELKIFGRSTIGRTAHYWVDVTHREVTTHPDGRVGPIVNVTENYEVEACCVWDAKTQALDEHLSDVAIAKARGGKCK